MARKPAIESLLLRGLRDTFEPLVKAIDAKPALLMEASADNGQTAPSAQDSGLKILLGQLCQTIWRQNYGLIQTKGRTVNTDRGPVTIHGSTIPNNDDRMKRSMADLANLEQEVAEEKTSMESKHAIALLHWYGVNEARLDTCNELLSSLMTIYSEVFNEEWKPIVYDESPTKAVSKTKAEDIPDAEKSRLLALLEKSKNRRVTAGSRSAA